jgi:hypothetical protein
VVALALLAGMYPRSGRREPKLLQHAVLAIVLGVLLLGFGDFVPPLIALFPPPPVDATR